ncbi:MAG: hypothetical protein KAS35_00085 [Candidatus Marinimicrobia bacterium]|nr:hypothetical protein [Candidatus Neomarinimicrobiota bacterium]
MIKIVPIFFFVLLIACNTSNLTFDIQNLNGNEIAVLGHRGMGKNHKYPGNTFESIFTALNLGANGSEMDVQVTKDSVLVIYHNKDLSSLTDCEGRVKDFNWSELDGCIYTTKDGCCYPVITVDELFSRIPEVQHYYFSFDCKLNYGDEDTSAYLLKFVYAVNKVIDDHNMHNKVMIETGNRQLHQQLKADEVQVLQFITGTGITDGIRIARELDLYGIGIGSSITRKDIELAHSNDLRVMTWIPKSKWANVKVIRKNPDFIQTAKLDHMVQLLSKSRPVI